MSEARMQDGYRYFSFFRRSKFFCILLYVDLFPCMFIQVVIFSGISMVETTANRSGPAARGSTDVLACVYAHFVREMTDLAFDRTLRECPCDKDGSAMRQVGVC